MCCWDRSIVLPSHMHSIGLGEWEASAHMTYTGREHISPMNLECQRPKHRSRGRQVPRNGSYEHKSLGERTE
ncbi:hypothetical protein SETIT_3G360200v2 [Setaria italica]|uniref:Uncharacterized protein n=1 Tax=Setaria italica TaxID=4555 RepID=A0A368QMD1_SETIT|nr:hypothetical protein SETIT_3G360200v2 [Setaria italica]